MRQFILGKKVAYPASNDLSALADGAVGFFYNDDGVPKVTATGSEITSEGMLILGRSASRGGNVVFPIHKNNFSYVKGAYQAATTFTATVTIPAPTAIGDYTLIVALKGVKFNERNKWSAMVHVRDTTMTATTLADKLTKAVNDNANSGVKATVSGATITITANKAGVDYNVLTADELYGTSVTISSKGTVAYGDAPYVQDLSDKAAADAGFEYTYRDAYTYLYPNYSQSPLKQDDVTDTGFTIFTIRFAEPRKIKTTDEAVNQIIQVAFPTGTAAITTFETVCKALSGQAAAEQDAG